MSKTQNTKSALRDRRRGIDHDYQGHLPYNLRMRFLTPKNDKERMVEGLINNTTRLIRLLENTGTPDILDYAEARIPYVSTMKEADRQQCLLVIRSHRLRKK